MKTNIFRSINFDLDTKAMKSALGSRTKGYGIIRRSLKEFGFSHRQGSGYLSDKPMSNAEVFKFAINLGIANPWLSECVKVFDITNTDGKFYDFADTIKDAAQSASIKTDIINGPNKQEKTTDGYSPAFLEQVSGLKQNIATYTDGSNNSNSKNVIYENE